MQYSAFKFMHLSEGMTARAAGLHSTLAHRRFHALFRCCLAQCLELWRNISVANLLGGHPDHLIWSLLLMKVYATESVLSLIAGLGRKTYRKWAWRFHESISNLNNPSSRIR